jgi:peptidoglycan/LPS O-acetylase OafA/YrhL
MTRYAALDGLRGVSAVAVALFHLPVAFHLFGTSVVREAYIFVDFFFVLSGFVIAHAYGARLTSGAELGSFLFRRIGRLWPLHLATLAVMVGLEFGRHLLATKVSLDVRPPFAGETALDLLLPNALLLHGWGYSVLSWNIPSWSISAELFAYIVFGLVVWLTRSRALSVAGLIVAVTWIVSVSIAVNVDLYSALATLRSVCGFFTGVLVHAAFTRLGRPNWSRLTGTALEIVAVGLIVGFLAFVSRHELTPWATPVFAAAIYVFAAERGLVSSLLKSGPLQLLGLLSYSIYLAHTLVITAFNIVAKLIGKLLGFEVMAPAMELFPEAVTRNVNWSIVNFGNFWLNDLYALAFIATVIGLSALTYRFIEVPGQKLFAGIGRIRLGAPATAS